MKCFLTTYIFAFQEITCYIDYNISMSAENLWRVDIVNPASDETGDNGKQAIWHSINSQVSILYYIIRIGIIKYHFCCLVVP